MPPEERKPTSLKGLPASPGISLGRVLLHQTEIPTIEFRSLKPEEAEEESRRFFAALDG